MNHNSPIGQMPEPQRLRPKGVADIVFALDSTGSMAPCFDEVRRHVTTFAETLDHFDGLKLDWRLRLLEYRDLTEGEPMVDYAFTKDVGEFSAQVNRLVATGGGSEPESTLDAVFTALQSDWRPNCNKCIVLFTDATCHPQMHPSTVAPGQPRDVDEVINKMYETRTRLFLFAPRFAVYDDLATAERVEYEVTERLGLKDVDFKKALASIAKTVSQSTEPVVEVPL